MPSPLPKLFEAARKRGFDPLLLAIAEYRVGVAAFNATPHYLTDIGELEALATGEGYGTALDALRTWNTPPSSMQSAIAGLELGIEELRNGDHEVADSMMESVLAFLRAQQPAA